MEHLIKVGDLRPISGSHEYESENQCLTSHERVHLRAIRWDSHNDDDLLHCNECDKYWLWRYHEYAGWSDDGGGSTWFVLLSQKEAESIIKADDINLHDCFDSFDPDDRAKFILYQSEAYLAPDKYPYG